MNEDRIMGAGRELLGKGERALGSAAGNEHLQGDGVVDQVAGAVEHGYGQVKDAVGDIVKDAPGAITHAVNRGRELGRHGDEAIRDRLGDNGPLYLIGGAIALFALGAFALTRSAPEHAPNRKPTARRRSAKAASKSVN